MKIVSSLVLVVSLLGSAMSQCSPNDNLCQDFSGKCSTTVENFFAALHPDATMGEIQSAAKANAKLFGYGKYCGATNKCPENGQNQNQPEPCNDIDSACQSHDTCLDSEGTNGAEGVGFPARCKCDIAFVAALKDQTPPFGSGPGDALCDSDFYGFGIPEAAVMAIPFCQTITRGCPLAQLADVIDYCGVLAAQFL
ncbi:expressed unknown protein [Seminavis robusta]|uniref:Phospholipase A2 n=1 Tax=Seminavis robusta TaxID=568900 RepID=A0A9N8EXV7_9STRA|nr:expressed unknown protein [Seminavis robusta]|eukprot:Sro2014_g311010.1 n/a (196) ;mRNA; f:9739-10326